MATDPIGSSTTVDRSKLAKPTDAFSDLQLEDFIKLMVTELQNQDPLNPMDNTQLLEQLSQMQSIQSTKGLSDTLTSMALGSSLATGGSLIGRGVVGLTEKGEQVVGTVDSASVTDGKTYVNVVDSSSDTEVIKSIPLTNLKQIL